MSLKIEVTASIGLDYITVGFPPGHYFVALVRCGEAGQAINYFYPWSPDYNRRGEQIANLGKVDHSTLKKTFFVLAVPLGKDLSANNLI